MKGYITQQWMPLEGPMSKMKTYVKCVIPDISTLIPGNFRLVFLPIAANGSA